MACHREKAMVRGRRTISKATLETVVKIHLMMQASTLCHSPSRSSDGDGEWTWMARLNVSSA
jgi:hypothetical protein